MAANRLVNPSTHPEEPEQDIWQGGYSAKAMFGQWLGALLLSILSGYLAYRFSESPVRMIAGVLVIAVWVWLIGKYLIHRFGDHYRLTTQRFFHRRGILSRVTDRIEIIDIDDITFRQGPVERMVGVGSILITSSDRSSPELWLHGIEDVQHVADLIDKARRTERRKRSVKVEHI